MTIRDQVDTLRRNWAILVVCLLVSVLGTAALLWRATPTYAASLRMFVSATGADAQLGGAYQSSLFTQDRVLSYAELVNSPDVTARVVKDLHLGVSPDALAGEIKAAVPQNTVLIDVTVTDHNAGRASAVANAVGRAFPDVLARVEGDAKGHPLVTAAVVRPATTPGSPVSPHIKTDLVLAVLVGLGVGVALVFLREALNVNVRGRTEVEALTGAPVLAEIPSGPMFRRESSNSLPRGVVSEAYRRLRMNLQLGVAEGFPGIVLVTSPNARDGKSSVCLELARSLTRAGVSVLAVDADLRSGALSRRLGIHGGRGVAGFLAGDHDLRSSIRARDGVRILPAGTLPSSDASELLPTVAMAELLAQLRKRAEVVLVDSPPIIPVIDAVVIAPMVDAVLLVTRHRMTKRSDLRQTVKSLQQVNAEVTGVVIVATPTSVYGKDRKYYRAKVTTREGLKDPSVQQMTSRPALDADA